MIYRYFLLFPQFSYVNTTNNFGIATFQNGSIPERAICSFYGNFYTSDGSQTALRPVQCITEKEDGAVATTKYLLCLVLLLLHNYHRC